MPVSLSEILAHSARMASFDLATANAAHETAMVAYYGPLAILYGSASVSEDDANGTTVAAAPVVSGGVAPLTFFLTDNAGGRFAIDSATGEITLLDRTLLSASINPTHIIEITVEDANNKALQIPASLEVTVTASQQGEAPVVTFSEQVALREGDANGTVAGIALFSGGVGTVTLSLQADPDGIFALNASTGELTLNDATTFDSLVVGGQTEFSATIRATDSASPTPNTDDEIVTIEGVLAGYDATAINFESVNSEYGVRTSALTGAVSSDALTLAFGFNMAEVGSNRTIVWAWDTANSLATISVRLLTTNELRIFATDAGGTTLLTLLTAPLTDINEWNYCLFSCRDGASKKDIVWLLNGSNALATESVNINGDIALGNATHWTYAAGNSGPGSSFFHFNGGLVDFMLAQTYVANDSGFRDGDGLLINPGSDGSAALGAAPLLFLGGPSFSIESALDDHSGNSNDFTPVGSLSVFEPGINNIPTPPSGTVINAASLSKADITAAINQATADGDVILLPAGDAGYTTPLAVSSPFKIHIRGQDWLGSKAAYGAAIDNLKALAEDVYDATLAGSGRASAWSSFMSAHSAFQPTTTGLMFTLESDGLVLSRLGFENLDGLTWHSVDNLIYWCRFDAMHVDIETSHYGGGLIAQCVGFETGILPSGRFNSPPNTQAKWTAVPVNPGSEGHPWVQDCIIIADDLSQAQGGSGAAAIDPTWHGSRVGARRCVFGGSNGGATTIRLHGYYKTGANCTDILGCKWTELFDILCIDDTDQSWQCLEWSGGGGYVKNLRNSYKANTFYLKWEALSRGSTCNGVCSQAVANYPNNFGCTAGSGDGGLYIEELYHKGSLITSLTSPGVQLQCTNLIQEDRDVFFSAKPGYSGLGLGGAHSLESKMVF